MCRCAIKSYEPARWEIQGSKSSWELRKRSVRTHSVGRVRLISDQLFSFTTAIQWCGKIQNDETYLVSLNIENWQVLGLNCKDIRSKCCQFFLVAVQSNHLIRRLMRSARLSGHFVGPTCWFTWLQVRAGLVEQSRAVPASRLTTPVTFSKTCDYFLKIIRICWHGIWCQVLSSMMLFSDIGIIKFRWKFNSCSSKCFLPKIHCKSNLENG